MSLVERQNYSNKKGGLPNTFIGGVASTISTPALLASKLAIDVSRITNFSIVGSDIKCRITGSYSIPDNCFIYNTSITKYIDFDSLVVSLGASCFQETTNIKNIEFKGVLSVTGINIVASSKVRRVVLPNCTYLADQGLAGNGNIVNVWGLPKVISLGTTSGNNNVFLFPSVPFFTPSRFYCPVALQTNNGGSPDGDISYFTTNGGVVTYVTNYTSPVAISNLSIANVYNNSVQVNFTPPVGSNNAISHYEAYVNGVYSGDIEVNGYVNYLDPSSFYNLVVYVVDVNYNKTISNVVSFTTTNVSDSYYTTSDTDALAYISASGITNTSSVNSTHHIVYQMKNKGLWSRTKALYVFKGTIASSHKFNVKNPVDTDAGFRLLFTGGGTFSEAGYLGNGTNSYANTKFAPASNQIVNDNGVTIVCGTNNATINGNVYEFGAFQSGSQTTLITLKNNNTDFEKRICINNYLTMSLVGTNQASGIFTAVRQYRGSAKFFRNNSLLATASPTGTLTTLHLAIGALNQNGSYNGFSNQRFQIVAIHTGFEDSEVSSLHSIIDISETIAGRKTW
jgi:hypothetical protein